MKKKSKPQKPPKKAPSTSATKTAGAAPKPAAALNVKLSEVVQLAADKIEPSRFNPRHPDPDAADIVELSESIRNQGIINALLVRPAGEKGKYELIAGERRYLAAARLGLATLPCRVGDYNDAETQELQAIENLQRANLTELEEAVQYQQMLSLRDDAGNAKYTLESLSERVGKQITTIYGRLKLLRAPVLAQKAYAKGLMNSSVMLLVSRIPNPKQAHEATRSVLDPNRSHNNVSEDAEFLKAVTNSQYGEPMSYRKAKQFIQTNYMIALKGAPFDKEDETLVLPTYEMGLGDNVVTFQPDFDGQPHPVNLPDPKHLPMEFRTAKASGEPAVYGVWQGRLGESNITIAHGLSKAQAEDLADTLRKSAEVNQPVTLSRVCGGKCSDCPFRTGNMLKLNPDLDPGSTDVCTNTPCFKRKKEAAFKRESAQAKDQGLSLLKPGKAAQMFYQGKLSGNHGYVDLNEQCEAVKGKKTWNDVLGTHVPENQTIAKDDHGKVHYLLSVEQVLEASKAAGLKLELEDDKSPTDSYEMQQQRIRAKEEAEQPYYDLLMAEVEAKARKAKPNLAFLKLVLREHLVEQHKPRTEADCLWLLVSHVFDQRPIDHRAEMRDGFAKVCKFFGVDVKGIRKQFEKDQKAALAKAAKEEAAQPKTEPPLSDPGNLDCPEDDED